MKVPLVSVLMPIYNNTSYARASIQSILDQTLPEFEFIIVDDGSNTETKNLLSEYEANDNRIVLLHNKTNIGLTRSLNKGLAIAQGEFIARQDADDISVPRRLEIQVAYLRAHTKVGILGTVYEVIDRDGKLMAKYRVPIEDTEIRWHLLFHSPFCHTAIVMRRSILIKHNLKYREGYMHVEDYEMWTRMLSLTMGSNLPEPLVFLRKHVESVSAMHRKSQYEAATRIAGGEVRKVWPNHPFSLSEIDTLRQWFNRFPQQLSKQDMILCRSLLNLLAIFEQQPNIDSFIVAHIKLRWTRRILKATRRLDQWADLVSSGLLKIVLRHSLPAAVVFMPTWLVQNAKRRIGRLSRMNTYEDGPGWA